MSRKLGEDQKLPTEQGNIRNVPVPNAKIGKDGRPTKKSLDIIYKHLSKVAGKGSPVDATYHDGADFNKMKSYVENLANNPNRDKYSVPSCNCYDFKNKVIKSGGSDN